MNHLWSVLLHTLCEYYHNIVLDNQNDKSNYQSSLSCEDSKQLNIVYVFELNLKDPHNLYPNLFVGYHQNFSYMGEYLV